MVLGSWLFDCTFFYLQRPSVGIFSGCFIKPIGQKAGGEIQSSFIWWKKTKTTASEMAKTQKVMHTISEGNRPTGCCLSTGTQHTILGHWQAQLGSSQLPQSGCICLAKGGKDSICQDEIEQRSSEPSRAVTWCTSIWLECKQGMLSSSGTQWAPCQRHTLFAIFASLIGSGEGRGERSAVHNDSHYVWCISSQD